MAPLPGKRTVLRCNLNDDAISLMNLSFTALLKNRRHGDRDHAQEDDLTAILAFASGDIAFVAADTMRDYEGATRVFATKVHVWSDKVLIAQAGDGKFLSQLIAKLWMMRPNILTMPDKDEAECLIHGFHAFRQEFYDQALDAYTRRYGNAGTAMSGGTILVAIAANGPKSACIHRLDFATGSVTTTSDEVAAGGSDPAAFKTNADAQLAARRIGSQPLRIDEWAIQCLDAAIVAYPQSVDWPADLVLARPDGHGGRLVLSRRVPKGCTAFLEEFLL